MSELVVAAYNREDTAAHVLAFLRAHTDELSLDLNSAAIVRVEDSGRYSVTTTAGPGGAGSPWSVLWSALFDLVFLVPTPGRAYGPSLGGVFGLLDRAGIDADFCARIRAILVGGTSGLAFLAAHVDPEPAFNRLAQRPSAIVRRVLSLEQDAELLQELGGVRP